LTVYFDTSAIVPLFLNDRFSSQAQSLVAGITNPLAVSEFAIAEFSAVAAMRVRTKAQTPTDASVAWVNLDTWAAHYCIKVETLAEDVRAADRLLRRLDLGLRAPDAIHLAIAQRLGAELATFDKKMATAARSLAIKVV
jgi:predicted nucleic acid-binding protein